jgi:hypothetical protein
MKMQYLAAAAAALTMAIAVPSLAANTGTDAAASTPGAVWSAANVDPKAPFGSIQTNAAGATPTEVGKFASGLSGQQVIELIGRCNVILAGSGMSGMGATFGMESTGTVGSSSGTSSGVAADPGSDSAGADSSTKATETPASDQAAADSIKTGAAAASGVYDQQSVQLCQNLNSAIFGSTGSVNQ